MSGEKNFRQLWMLTWTSLIGQFVHPVEGKGMGDCYFSQLKVSLN